MDTNGTEFANFVAFFFVPSSRPFLFLCDGKQILNQLSSPNKDPTFCVPFFHLSRHFGTDFGNNLLHPSAIDALGTPTTAKQVNTQF